MTLTTSPKSTRSFRLTLEQLAAPCSRYGLELRVLQMEVQTIGAVLEGADDFGPNEALNPDPREYPDLDISLVRVTKGECLDRLGEIQDRVRQLQRMVSEAQAAGVYYDVTGFLDWMVSPDSRAATPFQYLPFFGQTLLNVLAQAAHNTTWAHVEATISRQLAPVFGGSYDENQRTRWRQPGVGVFQGAPGAPGAPAG